MGLLSTKKAANSSPLLVILPVLTLAFHKYCKSRFEPAFRKYPLEVNSEFFILYPLSSVHFHHQDDIVKLIFVMLMYAYKFLF